MGNKLPAVLKEVAEPLAEAAAYEHLSLERRKGLLGLFSVVLLGAILLWRFLDWHPLPRVDPFPVDSLLLFAVVIALSTALRAILRKRPGWEPLFERPKGKRFWKRYLLGLGVLAVATVLGGILVFSTGLGAGIDAAFAAATMGTVGAFVLWLAPKSTPVGYSLLTPYIAAFLLAVGLVPASALVEVMAACLIVGTSLESAYRLFAPRRWIVR